ncbi:RNA polymerase sigma-70 factor, ECF subfamily [Chryseolinea serpens]|uniref:RNA polymerase sigma factor n=1 Tax=Chryseolinea serpens TaxID=947013 RepID=A0A1M5VQA0_9BACT|nr:RNA polymerase sigma factor [Chryseolinea serpens]SHH77360.1 RNA polymerase sigma-70 factor, ECF subfamily [Chryseolinea serpens]
MAIKRDPHTEDTFLEKAIRGDKAGLEYLVSAYKNLAYTIAIRIVLNREDAEEVVQDAFMKAFASLSKFKKASKFSTWLYRIVYNTALTSKASKRISAVDLNGRFVNEQYISVENQQWDLTRNTERKKYVEIALSRLSEEERLIITLHYIGELSILEICEIVNMKKSAIKMRLLRGRDQLEVELKLLLKDEVKDLL